MKIKAIQRRSLNFIVKDINLWNVVINSTSFKKCAFVFNQSKYYAPSALIINKDNSYSVVINGIVSEDLKYKCGV